MTTTTTLSSVIPHESSNPSTNIQKPSPSIAIRPALVTDAPALARLRERAFGTGALQKSSFPSDRALTATEQAEYLAWRTARLAARTSREDYHVWKAVDEGRDGEIVGCVALKSPAGSRARAEKKMFAAAVAKGDEVGTGLLEKAGGDVLPPKAQRYEGAPSWMNMAAFSEMEAKANAAREKFIGEREVWYVQGLFVDPELQGHRIGSRLLQQGLEFVDRDGLECYLEASPEGANVYRRLGFEVVEDMPLSGGMFNISFMIRPAQQSS